MELTQDDSYPSWFIAALAVIAVVLVGTALYLWFRRLPDTGRGRIAALPPVAPAEIGVVTTTASPTSVTMASVTPVLVTRKGIVVEPTLSPTSESVTATPTPVPTVASATTVETPTVVVSPTGAVEIMVVTVATPMVVPEATENAGTIAGQIALEGRDQHTGIMLLVDGTQVGTTDASGNFRLVVPVGHHEVQAVYPGYISIEASDVEVRVGDITTLPAASLPAGDTDDNGQIDLLDIVRCAANMRQKVPPEAPHVDVNGDGIIDLRELILTQRNYGVTGPAPW